MSDDGRYRPPTPEEDMQGLIAAALLFLLLVVLPLVASVWGAVRLFRWAGSGASAATAGRRTAARCAAVLLVVAVWGAVAAGVYTVVGTAPSAS